MKPRPTFYVNVKLWLHSDMCLGSFLDPQDIMSVGLGAFWNFSKVTGLL